MPGAVTIQSGADRHADGAGRCGAVLPAGTGMRTMFNKVAPTLHASTTRPTVTERANRARGMMAGSAISWVLVWTVVACLLVAAVTDLVNRIIPNSLTLVVLACGLGLRAFSGPYALLLSVLSAIVTLALLSLLGGYNLLGWGDVKLITAVTLVVPVAHVLGLLFAIVMAGGLLSSCYLSIRFVLRHRAAPQRGYGRGLALGRLALRERTRILANEPMPYAFAILGGVVYGLAAGRV